MLENTFGGYFIAIDGPNGVGKSTLISRIKDKLESMKYEVHITKEPTSTDLGIFVRNYAENHSGIGLACLVAANRYEHIETEIIQKLKEGNIVITDRYILSSLILQAMDNVDIPFIFYINSEIIKPDLQLAIYADESELQKRLAERSYLTRFEKNNQSFYEISFFKKGITELEKMGVNIMCVDNSNNLEENINSIVNQIIKNLEGV